MKKAILASCFGAILACAAQGCGGDTTVAGSSLSLTQVLYEEDFEGALSGIDVSSSCSTSTSSEYSGASGLRCTRSASVTVSVPVGGASGLVVSYARRTVSYDAGEVLVVEYAVDGGSWQALETADSADSQYELVSFPLQADGASAIELRFASNASSLFERFELDALQVLAEDDSPGADLCDGVDNDGDGQVDEDFASASTVCGIGACEREGVTQCVGGAVEDSCVAGPPAPDDSSCNGVDDDCDGQIDEEGQCDAALFGEDFESGLGGFVPAGSCSTNGDAYAGSAAARCGASASLTVQFDATGYADLVLTHAWKNSGYDAGEEIIVEASHDGISWTHLGSLGPATTYATTSMSFGALFDQQPNVSLRYRGTASLSWEYFFLDSVEVTGVPSQAPVSDPCDGADNDGDGHVDEDFQSEMTVCGVGACLRQGVTQCQGGSVVNTCQPAAPAPSDATCDGVDDDCDGQVDEDASCGSSVQIRMDGDAGAFFDMPWPSDHRVQANGRPDWTGYPSLANGQLGVGEEARDVAQATTPGFGTTSAVYFSVTGDLDPAAFPSAAATRLDSSPVLLVNLDDANAERVPVLLDYRASAGSATPGQLLSVLPHPGFPLEPDTRYAAIVFTHLPTGGQALAPAGLLGKLDGGDNSGTGLSAADFATLQTHKALVDGYLLSHSISPAGVAAFAVYTTRPFGQEMRAVAASVAALSDAQIESRISNVSVLAGCDETCPSAGACGPAELEGTVDTPIYISPIEFELNTSSAQCQSTGRCATTSGGLIEIDGQGRAVLQSWPQAVSRTSFRVLIPCSDDRPSAGWPIAFHAAGTGGGPGSVEWGVQDPLQAADETLRFVVGGITPWGTSPRHDEAVEGEVRELLVGLTGNTSVDTDGFMFNFLINPTAAGNNAVQSAADALFMKRVLALLPEFAGGYFTRLQLQLDASDLLTDPSRAMLSGQSQGSVVAPLTLSVAPSQGGYTDAVLNGTGGASVYDMVAVRQDTRLEFESAFLLDDGEMDRFHPLAQFLEATTEVARTPNYAHLVRPDNILITGGARDGCTVHEDAGAFVTALYRHGRIDAVETQVAFDGDPEWPVRPAIEGIENVLGASLLGLPVSGNLPEGGTGAYLLLEGGHFRSNAAREIGLFMHDLASGQTPSITKVDYAGYRGEGCLGRYQSGS